MKTHARKFAICIAGLYLAWGLFAYFGSLGTEGHDWWPLTLYFVIWPLGLIFELVSTAIWDQIFPHSAPAWAWQSYDCVAGIFYLGIGTLWVWYLSRAFVRGTGWTWRRLQSGRASQQG